MNFLRHLIEDRAPSQQEIDDEFLSKLQTFSTKELKTIMDRVVAIAKQTSSNFLVRLHGAYRNRKIDLSEKPGMISFIKDVMEYVNNDSLHQLAQAIVQQ